MTGAELRAIRIKLGLTLEAFGRALGYNGQNVRITLSQMEGESKPITQPIERLAVMFGRHGIPRQWK